MSIIRITKSTIEDKGGKCLYKEYRIWGIPVLRYTHKIKHLKGSLGDKIPKHRIISATEGVPQYILDSQLQ